MKQSIAIKLNQVNKVFYKKVGKYFDQTRRNFIWCTWEQLIKLIEDRFAENNDLSVLDVGCGNGRWGDYICKKWKEKYRLSYCGLDNNELLLKQARELLKNKLEIYSLIELDVVDKIIGDKKLEFGNDSKYEVIVVYGFMHHVPGYENRVKLIDNLKKRLNENGILIVSNWQFVNRKNLMKRVIKWEEIGIDESEVENNDFLLDWRRGKKACRYCHLVTDDEMTKIIRELNMKIVKIMQGDGREGNLNKYYVIDL